jgi:hypothetical protein
MAPLRMQPVDQNKVIGACLSGLLHKDPGGLREIGFIVSDEARATAVAHERSRWLV